MPQNSNFRLPRGQRFRPKLDLTVLAPNHGGDPLGSILGPMRSHWGQKMGQNRKKLLYPKIRLFNYPQSSILAKIWPHAYGPKSRWGPTRIHLGANGVPLGPKNGSKPKKITMPQNSNFRQSSISAKIGLYGYGVKSRWGPPRVHIGANGVPLGPKNGSKPKKNYHAPKFEFSTVIDFGQNWTLRLWHQITVGTP